MSEPIGDEGGRSAAEDAEAARAAGRVDIGKEIIAANDRFAVDLSKQEMPLDIAIRVTALTVAQRHCGDVTVKEGNLYQMLKMDNKLGGPMTVDHVVHAALVFERFLWGEWSKGLAGEAMAKALDEIDDAIRQNPPTDEEVTPPVRPTSGGEGA